MTTHVLDGQAGVPKLKPVGKQRRVWSSNPAKILWGTVVGKKVIMACTGVILISFLISHVLGNLKFFLGAKAIDDYALFLRTVGEPLFPYSGLLWVVRIVLLACIVLHVTAALQLIRINLAARPKGYQNERSGRAAFAAWTLRISISILFLFIIYHLLHLTAGRVGFRPGEFRHLAVHHNVVLAFSVWYVAVFYIVAMTCLFLHLNHGIWSLLQTLGFNNARRYRGLKVLSLTVALLVFIGFISVPIAVLAGWAR